MKRLSFSDAGFAGKRKQTLRKRFLIEMDQVVPSALQGAGLSRDI